MLGSVMRSNSAWVCLRAAFHAREGSVKKWRQSSRCASKVVCRNVEKRRSRVIRRRPNSDRETVSNFECRNVSRSVGLGRSVAESAVRLSSRCRNGRWEAVESEFSSNLDLSVMGIRLSQKPCRGPPSI